MKKTIIGVIVLLAAALIGLKYFSSKRQGGPVAPAPGLMAEQQGVALPPGATNYAAPDSLASFTPMQEGTGSYAALTLPAAALGLKGACEGGSPKEMLESLGKTWGYFTGRRNAFQPSHTQEMYNFVWEYQSCVAASQQDLSVCGELPGEPPKEALKFGFPRDQAGVLLPPAAYCRDKNLLLLFNAYAAGKNKDQQNCMNFVGGWDSEDLAKFSPGEFCALAGGGPGKILPYLKGKLPEAAADIEKELAFSKSACGSSADCLKNFELWEGIRTGNAERCPTGYKPNCAALEKKSPAPCSVILDEMSKKYCAYYKELFKSGRGYVGLTAEEVKEDLRAKTAKKAEEDRLRKQEEAATKQINEKVRKLMGKKGGEGE